MKQRLRMPIVPLCKVPLFEEVESMIEKYGKKYQRELDKKINGEEGIVGTEENFAEVQDVVIHKSYAYISHKLNDVLNCIINLLEKLEEDTKLCKNKKSTIDQMDKQYKNIEGYIYNYLYPLGISYTNQEDKKTLKTYAELSFEVLLRFLPKLDKLCEDYILSANNIKKFSKNIIEIEVCIMKIKKYQSILLPRIEKIISSLNPIFQIILLDEKEIRSMRKKST